MTKEDVFFNWLSCGNENFSKAIEEQEERGQQEVVKNHRLPIKANGGMSDDIKFAGITNEMEYEERSRISNKNIVE